MLVHYLIFFMFDLILYFLDFIDLVLSLLQLIVNQFLHLLLLLLLNFDLLALRVLSLTFSLTRSCFTYLGSGKLAGHFINRDIVDASLVRLFNNLSQIFFRGSLDYYLPLVPLITPIVKSVLC